jgi:hypothetical protein
LFCIENYLESEDMELVESYITDARGERKAVILDYKIFRRFEELLLDLGLAKAMEEVQKDEEIDMQEAIQISGFQKNDSQI